MNVLISTLTIGLILSLLAFGVYISFRIFNFPDITTEGSITLGAAVAAALILHGSENPSWFTTPWAATLLGGLAGGVAGVATGVLHTRFKIHGLLSGILVMTALYSINLRVMGQSNLSLNDVPTIFSGPQFLAEQLHPAPADGGVNQLPFAGWNLFVNDLAALAFTLLLIAAVGAALYFFFRTNLGTAMRATGDNAQMIRALGSNTNAMLVWGLGLSNALIALAGAIFAQYQKFADVQMGFGMVVLGLASVIIGEALVRSRDLVLTIIGAVMGSLLFRLLVAIALQWGLNPNDLKLITAGFVFIALVLPGFVSKLGKRKVGGLQHA
ncbi:MAG: ABC transporter permease [Verrucomicrobiota bacterium]|jgi:putative ABC transport system permease protein|nr:ABC transporter permease [Verrucomicrobiota bacterium]MDD8051356.1 ABC transporter permease [Verrucomicrobiota bacterium]MDI9384786.1 ABC transporter permease [Verrucomicrobiota bacterium]